MVVPSGLGVVEARRGFFAVYSSAESESEGWEEGEKEGVGMLDGPGVDWDAETFSYWALQASFFDINSKIWAWPRDWAVGMVTKIRDYD